MVVNGLALCPRLKYEIMYFSKNLISNFSESKRVVNKFSAHYLSQIFDKSIKPAIN